MKKILLLSLIAALTLSSCLYAETPEVTKIRWARANSGNVLVTLAQNNGYLKEYGLEVIEMPLNSTHDALTALSTKQVDVTSNNGTNNPLQFMAAGSDFTIVGGYMLKGMYIVAKKGTGWKGIGDLVGKKMATSKSQTWVTGPLLAAGYSLDDVIWLTYSTNSDRLAAVIAGEADYACLSGDLLFRVGNLNEQPPHSRDFSSELGGFFHLFHTYVRIILKVRLWKFIMVAVTYILFSIISFGVLSIEEKFLMLL